MPEIILAENWYAEPFSKRKTCEVPGQCGGDCDCGCPYNMMTEVETLPLLSSLAEMFPNEWLAFITSSHEDDDPLPTHGKLVAHSPQPDEIFDAVNTVLWNQCVYVFFNGDFVAMQASYSQQRHQPCTQQVQPPRFETPGYLIPPQTGPVPETLLDLVYSSLDQLYRRPACPAEAMRRLRIAKARLSFKPDHPLHPVLDQALDLLEVPNPDLSTLIWTLEEALVDMEEQCLP